MAGTKCILLTVRMHDDDRYAVFFLLQRSDCLDLNPHRSPVDFGGTRPLPFFYHAMHLGIIFLCFVGLLCESSLAQNDVTARKRVLSERLDSIDLEKQLRKRRGESLEDLEKVTAVLKDSITAVKRLMPSGSLVVEGTTDSTRVGMAAGENTPGWLLALKKFLPRTFFDWMVDIVGFVAIVSGIVLIIGIFGLLTKGFKKKKEAPPQPKTLHEIFPRSYAADAYDRIPKVPLGPAEEKDETVQSLRKRIENDESVLATVDDRPEPSAAVTGVTDAKAVRDPVEIKKQVVQASRQGLDVSEISRRFHLSSDEVSLILRIARQNDAGTR
jgi:hypothetical protein